MSTAQDELKRRIARIRAELADYAKTIQEVEEADDFDYPYWQGLTDEEGWLKNDLAKLLDMLDE